MSPQPHSHFPDVPVPGDYRGRISSDIWGMIDGHAHFNAVDTYPAQLLYNNHTNSTSAVRRLLASIAFPDGVYIQRLTTEEIGSRLVELNTVVFNQYNHTIYYYNSKEIAEIQKKKVELLNGRSWRELHGDEKEKWKKLDRQQLDIRENNGGPFIKTVPSLVIAPTMDMEFAHLAGYYNIDENDGKPKTACGLDSICIPLLGSGRLTNFVGICRIFIKNVKMKKFRYSLIAHLLES